MHQAKVVELVVENRKKKQVGFRFTDWMQGRANFHNRIAILSRFLKNLGQTHVNPGQTQVKLPFSPQLYRFSFPALKLIGVNSLSLSLNNFPAPDGPFPANKTAFAPNFVLPVRLSADAGRPSGIRIGPGF
ncbi:MAG: hypothetical protein AAF998_11750 [Bacteroidota bacterium]